MHPDMKNTINRPSFEKAFYETLTTPATLEAGFTLLREYLSRNPTWLGKTFLSSDDLPWPDKIKEAFPKKLPFLKAVVVGMLGLPEVRNEKTADNLLSLDPDAFSFKDNAGQWIAFRMVHQNQKAIPPIFRYHQHTIDKRKKGFALENPNHDAWFARVIESLPDEAFKGNDADEAWQFIMNHGNLGMRFGKAFMARGSRFQIMSGDKNGLHPLQKAKHGDAWTAFLKQGGDPYQIFKNKPLWQTILPLKTQAFFEKNSLKETVEKWVRKQSRLPQSDPKMKKLIESYARERAGNDKVSDTFYSRTARKTILEDIPNGEGFFIRTRRGNIVWETCLQQDAGDEAYFWSNAIYTNPQWRACMKKEPLLEALVYAVLTMNQQDLDEQGIESVCKTMKDATFKMDVEVITEHWEKKEKQALKEAFLHLKLQQSLGNKGVKQNRRRL